MSKNNKIMYPCEDNGCSYDYCPYFDNCDQILTCYIDFMPYNFISNQQSIRKIWGELKQLEEDYEIMKQELINIPKNTRNMEGVMIKGLPEIYYQFNERAYIVKVSKKRAELSILQGQEFRMKREWRKKILEVQI